MKKHKSRKSNAHSDYKLCNHKGGQENVPESELNDGKEY